MVENVMKCIWTDKYTYEVSTDYLTCEDLPEADFIITNPPFCVFTPMLEKVYSINCLGRVHKFNLFNQYGVIVHVRFPKPRGFILQEALLLKIAVLMFNNNNTLYFKIL